MTRNEAISILLDFYVVEYGEEDIFGVANTPGELTDDVMKAWGVLRKLSGKPPPDEDRE